MDFCLAASAEEKVERVNTRNIGGKNKASHVSNMTSLFQKTKLAKGTVTLWLFTKADTRVQWKEKKS